MRIATRWLGLCCMFSAVLAGACDSGSSNENGAIAGNGVGGDASAGTANGDSGASSAGTSTSAGTANRAGNGPSEGGSSGSGVGGTTSGGGTAGEPVGGASNMAGAPQGGVGGNQGGGSCGGAQVVFLIQRSGALFEQPLQTTGVPVPLEASYFGFVQAALVGDGSVAKSFAGKLPIGVSFLFAARDQVSSLPATCPQLVTTAPSLQFATTLATAFSQAAADHRALVMTAKQKAEAPVPESITSAVAAWSGVSGARHLVLVTAAMPDTCTQFDGPCGIDATVKAVQDAQAAGVTTHVIGLGDDNMFNYASSDPEPVAVQTGYEEYLQQLANAGSGKPVGSATMEHKLQDYVCNGSSVAALTASYSDAAGDAKYYQVMTATDAKAAVADILANICP